MLPAGAPAKARLPLVLYKGLLRKAKLFDRYPILKAYCHDPLRRGTLYIPSVSFHTIIKESFRVIPEKESTFDISRGFKMYREWNDVYVSVSKRITWYNQTLPEATKREKQQPAVLHIQNITPGSVLISHPAAFEKNEGSEIVLILQRNEYETMGLLIQGKDLCTDDDSNSLFSPKLRQKDNIFSQLGDTLSSESEFAQDLKDFHDETTRKVIVVDSDMDLNGPFAIRKFSAPLSENAKGAGEFHNAEFQIVEGEDYDDSDYGYDAYDYENMTGEADDNEGDSDIDIDVYDEELIPRSEYDEDDYDEDRDLDQIADDGRGKENNPSVLLEEVNTKEEENSATPAKKSDAIKAKTVYKGGSRFLAKYVVIYTRPNKSKIEGHWLSDNLCFEVFSSKEAMNKSKIVTLPPQQYRIFQGYHLFNTETLEKQVADGAYFICHTPLEILHFDNLDKPPVLSTEEIWSNILMEMGGEFSHFAYSRKSPMEEKVTTE
jgi:putative AlgH/UPF0301 family transcriptional regulator